MTDERTERAAVALYTWDDVGRGVFSSGPNFGGGGGWERASEGVRTYWRAVAKVALDAAGAER